MQAVSNAATVPLNGRRVMTSHKETMDVFSRDFIESFFYVL